MSTNTWEPSPGLPENPHHHIVQWAILGNQKTVTDNIQQLSEQQVKLLQPFMKQDMTFWLKHSESLDNQQILQLIYFFTIAENNHSLLFAGNQSPVIALNRILKQRQCYLSKEDLLWIKQHSSNRFLPNGSLNLQVS